MSGCQIMPAPPRPFPSRKTGVQRASRRSFQAAWDRKHPSQGCPQGARRGLIGEGGARARGGWGRPALPRCPPGSRAGPCRGARGPAAPAWPRAAGCAAARPPACCTAPRAGSANSAAQAARFRDHSAPAAARTPSSATGARRPPRRTGSRGRLQGGGAVSPQRRPSPPGPRPLAPGAPPTRLPGRGSLRG